MSMSLLGVPTDLRLNWSIAGGPLIDGDLDEEEEEWEDFDSEEEEEEDEDDEEYEEEEEDSEEEEEEEVEMDEEELKAMQEKEARRLRRLARPSPTNIEGAIPKEQLRIYPNETIAEILEDTKKEIESLKTEIYIFERIIDKLEEPERIVEEMFAARNEKESESEVGTGTIVCPSDSESEKDEENPDFSPIIPIEEINVSTDSFFDNMSDNSKEATLNYFRHVGALAPPNFDVIRYKYGDLVKGGTLDETYSRKSKTNDVKINPTRLPSEIYQAGVALLEEKNRKVVVNQAKAKVIILIPNWDEDENEGEDEEELDYPDFDIVEAKQIPLEDKLKFAANSEEDFKNKFYDYDTKALKKEAGLDVSIASHKHSIRLISNLLKKYQTIIAETKHPLSKKSMLDLIQRFKRIMRNQLSAEETKTRMEIRKVMQQRYRAAHQLRVSRNAATAVSEVDFEHLMVENEIITNEINEINISLKYLKQLSSIYFHILVKDRNEIATLRSEEQKVRQEVERRKQQLRSFERVFSRYRHLINRTEDRLMDMKQKLTRYHAPTPSEYIKIKSAQFQKEAEVAHLQRRLKELTTSLYTARSTFASLCKKLPKGDQTMEENLAWLQEVREEVEGGKLMDLLKEDSDEENPDFPESLKLHQDQEKKSQQQQGKPLPSRVTSSVQPLTGRESNRSSAGNRTSQDAKKSRATASHLATTTKKSMLRGLKTNLGHIPNKPVYDTDSTFLSRD